MSSNDVIEPNFDGEEMKMPESGVSTESIAPAKQRSLINVPIIILLGLILLAVLGGLYYWYYMVISTPLVEPAPIRPTNEMNNEPESTTAEARTAAMDVVSTSDELEAIEADIDSTNLQELDAEMNAIDAELNAAMTAQ